MTSSSSPAFPYDAIMICSYGGPRRDEDVLPFMRNATAGRGVPDARLLQVSKHYGGFAGVSPINARNLEVAHALTNQLRDRGITVPVQMGNRNWTPFMRDTLTDFYQQGYRRILCVFSAAYVCYSACRQYREDLAAALQQLAMQGMTGMSVDKIRPYYTSEGFVSATTARLADALDTMEDRGHTDPAVLLVTHSIPQAMQDASGPADHSRPNYVAQHMAVAAEVCARVAAQRGREPRWQLAFCSRSGPPHIPWLEPDVNDVITQLAKRGETAVITQPIGFINDHMEVVYDLDTEAKQTAEDENLAYLRGATVGTHPDFIAALADLICERAEIAGPAADALSPTWPACPPAGDSLVTPDAAPVAAACGEDAPASYPLAGEDAPVGLSGPFTPATQADSKEEKMNTDTQAKHGHPGAHPGGHPGGHPGAHPGGHPGAHPGGYGKPADPRDHEVDAEEVNSRDNFAFYGVFKLTRALPADLAEREQLCRAAEHAIGEAGAEIRGWYDTAGFRAEVDLMLWLLADGVDKIQGAYHALVNSALGGYLRPVWSNVSAHMVAEFNRPHLPACFGGWGARGYMAVYPLNRSWDWYYLPKNRRAGMLKEHGMNGRDYLDVAVSTLATFALSDYEWTIALEHDDITRIMGVLRQQRDCEARLYVREDVPFYTGKRLELAEWARLHGGQ